MAWISKTWGGPNGLAASGRVWGTFMNYQLISVACTFFLGQTYEEIGVVTEPGCGESGFSAACVTALCRDIHARGHAPSWTTSPDSETGVAFARELGFVLQRHDQLVVVGLPMRR